MKAVAILALALSGPALAQPPACESWLSDRYRAHEIAQTIRDYERDGARHYRANYHVVTILNEVTTIGLDCTVFADGRVRAIPEADPFPAEKKPAADNDLPRTRLKYGADGCPDLRHWRDYVDEMKAKNWTAPLSNACRWIDEGQIVLGPVDKAEYRGAPFVLIQLPGGNRYWIEPASL